MSESNQTSPAFAPFDPPGSYVASQFAAEGRNAEASLLDLSANRLFDDFFDPYFG